LQQLRQLVLRPGHDRRARDGHPWVFSNELATIDPGLAPGDAAAIHTAKGEFLGTAYFNPHSLITARVLSREREDIDRVEFFRNRLDRALAYRRRLYGRLDGLRLVFGEGDELPGLVVDRYGDVLAVQFLTLGIERRRELILAALQEALAPAAVIARNDVAVRELEGLEQRVELLAGRIPEPVIYREGDLEFRVDLTGGQKTGAFLDQKENHRTLAGRVESARVLDLFCYAGGWSLHAARFGAASVTGIDISAAAVALAEDNARRNGLERQCRFQQGDVFDRLRELGRAGDRFDLVILDPPAFIKSRKKLEEGLRGYLTVNRRALELVAPGGYLVTCSCSHHLDPETFLGMVRQAARQARRSVRLLELRGQAFDHPVLLSCPETAYLKCAVLQLS
jgi:23S rRNA (cytosine1962-C5)-methyltransferase